MPRPQDRLTILRETPHAAPANAPVIDVKFEVVHEGRTRGFFRALWTAFVAIAIAAAVGFLIPPLWVLAQSLSAN